MSKLDTLKEFLSKGPRPQEYQTFIRNYTLTELLDLESEYLFKVLQHSLAQFSTAPAQEFLLLYARHSNNSSLYGVLRELYHLNKELLLEISVGFLLENGIQDELEILHKFIQEQNVKLKLENSLLTLKGMEYKKTVARMLIQNIKEQDLDAFSRGFLEEKVVQFLKRERIRDLLTELMVNIWKKVQDSTGKVKENMFKVVQKLLDSGVQVDKEFGFWILEDMIRIRQEVGLEFLEKVENLGNIVEIIGNDFDAVQIAFLQVLMNIQDVKVLEFTHEFLENCVKQSQNSEKRVLAAAILCKTGSYKDSLQVNLELMLKELWEVESNTKSIIIEALAVQSLNGRVKEILIAKKEFMVRLKSLVELKDKSIDFGIANIYLNIGKYKERLSQEQEQLKKIQEMSKGVSRPEMEDSFDDESFVEKRNRSLIQYGAMDAIVFLSKNNPSLLLSDCLAQCLLNLAVDKYNRGKIIQQGGLKALLNVLKSANSKGIKDASQAIAKLLITTDPTLAFKGISAFEFVKPMIDLTRGNDTLCQFEALLALTNLASIGPDLQTRIIQGDTIKSFESMIFSDHPMIRRAATELVCNLMYEPSVFERYVNCGNSSRLKLMVALSDCEDFETRRAASGVLAILSSSKQGLISLSKEPRFFPVLQTLFQEDSLELLHRSFEVFKNCLIYIRDEIPSEVMIGVESSIQKHAQINSSLTPLATSLLTQIKQK